MNCNIDTMNQANKKLNELWGLLQELSTEKEKAEHKIHDLEALLTETELKNDALQERINKFYGTGQY